MNAGTAGHLRAPFVVCPLCTFDVDATGGADPLGSVKQGDGNQGHDQSEQDADQPLNCRAHWVLL